MKLLDLQGKKGLVIGIANAHSIAYGCAEVLKSLGAEVGVTYLNEKARPYVAPLAEQLSASFFEPLDVAEPHALEAVFSKLEQEWGELDFIIHSIAWSPLNELHGRLLDTSAEGFAMAMNISCHSFIQIARLAEPLMKRGGTLITMSYQGSERVVEHYNMMGPVKAALESSVRYMAAELGGQGIRVHAVSPGPMQTRAASGIDHFDELVQDALVHSPLKQLSQPEDVGNMVAFLVSDRAKRMTGTVTYVDAGHHIMA